MDCPNCNTLNPAGARFCLNCGTRLAVTCANCGTLLPDGAKFCFNCGHPVEFAGQAGQPIHAFEQGTAPPTGPSFAPAERPAHPTPAPVMATARIRQYIPAELLSKLEAARANRNMVGERRVVTVLFCDIKGSTAMAEQLDPEEWAEVVNGAFKYLIEPVYRYEGTLARLMGDAILAFFGAPIAHEDDPYRAVRAALDILEGIRPYCEEVRARYGFDLSVRVGINTGLVVVGEVGSDLRVEYTAMGDAVNVAARMEQTAEPGTVQISASTYKSVSALFDFEALGEVELKGKAEPVRAYRVKGRLAGAVPVRGIEGLRSPLVGRDHEMHTLQACIADLMAGRGQVISVVADAGVGKSRLVAELREWAATAYPALQWHEGRSYSYETAKPYAPFTVLFSSMPGIGPENEEGDREQAYAGLRAGVGRVLPGREAELAPFLATMLGVQVSGEDADRVKYLEPPQLRERIFQAVHAFVEASARARPTVVMLEDLHWIDPTSLELLERLLPLTDSTALMVLVLFRPAREDPSWRFHELASRHYGHRYTQVALEPLDEPSARQLVANLLEIEDLPEKVRMLILRKAEGNPFFVEEVIRSMLDMQLVVRVNSHWRATQEVENIAVPDTLVGVILARLDRLEEDCRQVAQTASVIGREFAFDVLAQVHEAATPLDQTLWTLQRRELVREKRRLPDRVYMFKHVLTQETAYSSLLLSRRRELHRRVAECLERRQPDLAADIARHFLNAKEDARALPYLIRAGDSAFRNFAGPEALGYYRHAIRILGTMRDVSLARHAYEGLGQLLLLTDPQSAVEHFARMHEYALAEGDVPMQVSALNRLAQASMWLGQFDDLMSNLAAAEALARQYDDVQGLAEAYTIRCGVCNSSGDFDGAAHYLGESIQIGSMIDNAELKAFGLTHTAMTMIFMTRFDEALETAHRAMELVEQIGHRMHQSELLAFVVPYAHMVRGDLDGASGVAAQGLELAHRIGAPYPQSLACYTLGMIAQLRGEYEEAVRLFTEGVDAGQASGYPPFAIMNLAALGTTLLSIGDGLRERTAELHRQVLAMMENPVGMSAGGNAWWELGCCALIRGDVDEAYRYFQMGLTVPTNTGLIQRPRFQCGLALACVARGELEQAAEQVVEARRYVEERTMRLHYPLVSLTEAVVHLARGDTQAALYTLEQAEQLALAMGMRPLLVDSRALASHVLTALGQPAQAEIKGKQAEEAAAEIAGLFEDAGWRDLYVHSTKASPFIWKGVASDGKTGNSDSG